MKRTIAQRLIRHVHWLRTAIPKFAIGRLDRRDCISSQMVRRSKRVVPHGDNIDDIGSHIILVIRAQQNRFNMVVAENRIFGHSVNVFREQRSLGRCQIS
jgi:hypothetical protein